MPNKPKSIKPIKVEVNITFPRSHDVIVANVALDPNSVEISGAPTATEIQKALRAAVLDKIKVQPASGEGRRALAAVKAAQKARREADE